MNDFAFVAYDFSCEQEEDFLNLAAKCGFDFRFSHHAPHDVVTREHWHIYIFCLPGFNFDGFLSGFNLIFRVPLVQYKISYSRWLDQVSGGESCGHF